MALETTDILLRIGVALIASAVIGFERESHGRAAGLRTTVLVGVAAALAMILSEILFDSAASPGAGWRPDPARLAAGVLTGMGFLGAGTIIREGNVIRGVTTAATLWMVAMLGLAFGSGQLLLGGIGWGVAVFTLFVLPSVEHFVKNDWYGTLTLQVSMDGIGEDEVRRRLKTLGVSVKRLELDYDLVRKTRFITLEVKFKKEDLFELTQRIVADLVGAPGILEIKWR